MSNAKESYEKIRKFNEDYDDYGLFGFVIAESANEYDGNSYEDIGRSVDLLVDKYPDSVDMIEEVVTAVTGYSFATIMEKMQDNRSYYESL